jgi:hypothetical protein
VKAFYLSSSVRREGPLQGEGAERLILKPEVEAGLECANSGREGDGGQERDRSGRAGPTITANARVH